MKNTKCRNCAGKKTARQILCGDCWKALPAKLRADFNQAPDNEARRMAIRKIYDHANGTPSML